jgi:DNA-directed RNA polymerase specialized sigma24 family protein
MIFSDSDRKRIEKQFDSYCKKTVRNRARDIYRAKGQRRQQEVLFSELSYEPAAPETLYKVNMNSFSC